MGCYTVICLVFSFYNALLGLNAHTNVRAVVGDYDGVGGDEVAVFYNRGSFTGGGFLTFIDLDTLEAPSYWSAAASDDVALGLGWTDKQL